MKHSETRPSMKIISCLTKKKQFFEKDHGPILIKNTFLESAKRQLSNGICYIFWEWSDLPTNRASLNSRISGLSKVAKVPLSSSEASRSRGLPLHLATEVRRSTWSMLRTTTTHLRRVRAVGETRPRRLVGDHDTASLLPCPCPVLAGRTQGVEVWGPEALILFSCFWLFATAC